jgi:hypothetical protein
MMLQHLDTLIGFATVMLGVSLIITILTQMISALLGLRGTNLRWGIQTLLENASPDLKDCAKTVAFDVLNHRLVSDSTFSKFESFFGRWRLATAIRPEELIDIIVRLQTDSSYGETIKNKEEEIKKVVTDWFDSMMDRVGQRFAMSMRYWTVGFAIVLAFVLHLDGLALLNKLSRDQTVRANLVAAANAVIHETENVLGANGTTNLFSLSTDQLKQLEPGATKGLTNAPKILSREAAFLWLRSQLTNTADADRILSLYGQLVTSNTVARAPELMGSIGIIQTELAQAGLGLVPDYKRIDWRDYSPFRLSFWGMLISAGLLSLGAPFWYNGLKTLLSLRPALAARVKKEREGESGPN